MNSYIHKSFLIILIGILLSMCATPVTLVDKTVTHTYTNIEFEPHVKSNSIGSDISMSIEPIDASSLNEVTLRAANRAGDYEQEVVREYFNNSNERIDDPYTERLIEVSNKIMEDMYSGSITNELAYSLIERVWTGQSVGMDGSENSNISESMSTSSFNPYHIGRGYLSVFKLSFENNSNEVKTLGFNQFQVSSGNEILYPFDMEYFEDRLSDQDSKLENAFRYNLPNSMNIAPGQTVEKYIAVPAIDSRTNSVTVQYFNEDNSVNQYDFMLKQIDEEIEVDMKNYVINPILPRHINHIQFNSFYAVQLADGTTFPLKEDKFYLPEEETDQLINICQVHAGKTTSRVNTDYACKEVNLSGNDGHIRVSFN